MRMWKGEVDKWRVDCEWEFNIWISTSLTLLSSPLIPSFFSLSSLFRDVRLIPKTLLLLSEVARDSCKHSEARNRRILESLA